MTSPLTTNQQTIQDIYGTHLGRQAAPDGLDYWSSQLDAGKSVADVIRGIQSGSEYQNRQALVTGAGDAGITEAQLDKMVLPGGWKTEHHTDYATSGQNLLDFNRGNTWNTGAFGTDWAKKQNTVNTALGATSANNYSTVAGANTGNYEVGVTHDAAGNPITNTGTGDTGTGDTGTGDTGTGDTGTGDTGTGSNYLTAADLTTWWDALDKPWLNQASDTSTSTSGGMDDFMKFMMFMSMMRPQGGGYGGGQYGYGGLNPGGVQSAYNPMSDIQSAISAFQTIPGIGTNLTNTGATP